MQAKSHEEARAMAIRAARAVTMGLALTSIGTGCASAHEGGPDPDIDEDLPGYASYGDQGGSFSTPRAQPQPTQDAAAPPEADSGEMPSLVFADAGADDAALEDAAIAVVDASVGPDAGMCVLPTASDEAENAAQWEKYSDCCDAHAWAFEWGCFAWGPFVPPGELA